MFHIFYIFKVLLTSIVCTDNGKMRWLVLKIMLVKYAQNPGENAPLASVDAQESLYPRAHLWGFPD